MSEIGAGTTVMVIKDGKICTGIRKNTAHGQGQRSFPGGHIDFPDQDFNVAGEREVLEETGMKVKVRELSDGGYDLFTTMHITTEDGKRKYVTIYLVADYIEGGNFISDDVLQGLEPDKCETWEFHEFEELERIIKNDPDQWWIQIDRIKKHIGDLL